MAKVKQLLLIEHLDVWTSAVKAKSSAGRGSNKKIELYGIRKLRQLILELAVRGSLTPSETQWSTAQFGEIFDIQGGSQPPKSQFISEPQEGYVRLLQIRDLGEKPVPTFIPENLARRFCDENDILIGRYGASVGKIFRGQKGSYNVALAKLIWRSDTFTQDFLISWLKSEAFQKRLEGASRSAQAGFNKGDLATIQIQFPPLAEQHRIVDKVDELMGLCDQLEQEQESNLETHETLVSTLLSALTTASVDASQFAEAWKRIDDNFDILFTTENSVDQLKQTILQLAVIGKLVPQDLGTEQNSIETKIGECVVFQNGYAFKSSWYEQEGVRVCRNANIGHGCLNWFETKRVSAKIAKEFDRFSLKENDIVLSLDRPLINTGLKIARLTNLDLPSLLLQRVAKAVPDCKMISSEYLYMWLTSPAFIDSIDPGRSNGVPHISTKQVQDLPILLPPLSEQHRIVAKVDESMALCEQLKANLAAAETTQLNLADTLVEQVIN